MCLSHFLLKQNSIIVQLLFTEEIRSGQLITFLHLFSDFMFSLFWLKLSDNWSIFCILQQMLEIYCILNIAYSFWELVYCRNLNAPQKWRFNTSSRTDFVLCRLHCWPKFTRKKFWTYISKEHEDLIRTNYVWLFPVLGSVIGTVYRSRHCLTENVAGHFFMRRSLLL